MKRRDLCMWVATAGWLLFAPGVPAQTAPAAPAEPTTQGETTVQPPRQRDRVGRVLLPERPRGNLNPGPLPVRPDRAEHNAVPREVQDRLQRFRTEANRYLAQQEALRKELLGATTDTERETYRQQLSNLRAEWFERQRTLREEFRERQMQLPERMPSRRELLDNLNDLKQNTRDQLRDQRKRRGTD